MRDQERTEADEEEEIVQVLEHQRNVPEEREEQTGLDKQGETVPVSPAVEVEPGREDHHHHRLAHVLQPVLAANDRRYATDHGQRVSRDVQLMVPCDVHVLDRSAANLAANASHRHAPDVRGDPAMRRQFFADHAIACRHGLAAVVPRVD